MDFGWRRQAQNALIEAAGDVTIKYAMNPTVVPPGYAVWLVWTPSPCYPYSPATVVESPGSGPLRSSGNVSCTGAVQ